MSIYPSSQKLAAALRDAGLQELADRADKDEFNDFFSPHPFPLMMLVNELNKPPIHYKRKVRKLIERVVDGEFDGTKEESEAWAQSPEGKESFRKLVEGE